MPAPVQVPRTEDFLAGEGLGGPAARPGLGARLTGAGTGGRAAFSDASGVSACESGSGKGARRRLPMREPRADEADSERSDSSAASGPCSGGWSRFRETAAASCSAAASGSSRKLRVGRASRVGRGPRRAEPLAGRSARGSAKGMRAGVPGTESPIGATLGLRGDLAGG